LVICGMVEKKYPEGLVPLIEQVRELEKNKPYDRRKREYKDAEKQIEEITKLANVIIVKDAVKTMNDLAFPFEVDGESSSRGKLKIDDFVVYIVPSFRVGYRNDDATAHWYLSDTFYTGGWSSHAWIWNTDEGFVSKVSELIQKKRSEFIERNRVSDVNQKNAMSFSQKVEKDWTSRSGDWRYAGENRPWAGDQIEMESKEPECGHFYEDASLRVEFHDEKFSTHLDVRKEFTNEEEALAFWNKAKELIESIGYVKKERRE